MLVYRITNQSLVGVYRAIYSETLPSHLAEILKSMGEEHSDMETHPSGFYDNIPNYSSDCFFGCDSLEKLLAWFDAYLLMFEELNYIICVYDAPVVNFGDSKKQVTFDVTKATLVEKLPISAAYT